MQKFFSNSCVCWACAESGIPSASTAKHKPASFRSCKDIANILCLLGGLNFLVEREAPLRLVHIMLIDFTTSPACWRMPLQGPDGRLVPMPRCYSKYYDDRAGQK